jgi:uncharacterized membrane protein
MGACANVQTFEQKFINDEQHFTGQVVMGQIDRVISWVNQWLHYQFKEEWMVEAPVEQVWDKMVHVDEWPQWWKGLEVEGSVDDLPVVMAGKRYKTRWKGPLPYHLDIHAVIRETTPHASISADIHGDIEGTCTCRIQANRQGTRGIFALDVRTAAPWMTLLSPFLKGYFSENHNRLMAKGMQGFTQSLARETPCSNLKESMPPTFFPHGPARS